MPSLNGQSSNAILQRGVEKGKKIIAAIFCKQSSTVPNLIISSTDFPAGGHVAGTPSKMGRSLFYQAALIVKTLFFIMPL